MRPLLVAANRDKSRCDLVNDHDLLSARTAFTCIQPRRARPYTVVYVLYHIAHFVTISTGTSVIPGNIIVIVDPDPPNG